MDMQRNSQRRRRGNTRPTSNQRLEQRISALSNQVYKTKPFQVRKNRQLISIPAHRESGLNIERIFRFRQPFGTALTTDIVRGRVLDELGVDLPEGAYARFTVKDARFYSYGANLGVLVYYASVDLSNIIQDAWENFTDESSTAGINTIEVVFPTSVRPSWITGEGNRVLAGFLAPAGTIVTCDFTIAVTIIQQDLTRQINSLKLSAEETSSAPSI
jgi:hypothetical protein